MLLFVRVIYTARDLYTYKMCVYKFVYVCACVCACVCVCVRIIKIYIYTIICVGVCAIWAGLVSFVVLVFAEERVERFHTEGMTTRGKGSITFVSDGLL